MNLKDGVCAVVCIIASYLSKNHPSGINKPEREMSFFSYTGLFESEDIKQKFKSSALKIVPQEMSSCYQMWSFIYCLFRIPPKYLSVDSFVEQG
jgi:hypothetical protein